MHHHEQEATHRKGVFSYTYIHLAKKTKHTTFKADRFSLTCERGDDAGVCYHVLANVY